MMKQALIALTLVAVTPILLATSCKKEHGCEEDVICTAVFAQVSAEVRDNNQQPVTLDDAYTIRVTTGDIIHLDQGMAPERYVVLDDSYQDELANKTETFRFVGMKNGQKIVDEVYKIGADCCHIDKKNGKDEIEVVAVP